MKVIFRILVILVVATLIGGAMYAAVSTSGSATQTRERREFNGERPAPPDGQFRPEREREGFGGGAMLPFGMVKSLIVISLIGVICFLWMKWQAKQKRQTVIGTA